MLKEPSDSRCFRNDARLLLFLSLVLLLSVHASALAPLQTMSKPTARIWREDMFDLDLITTMNQCSGTPGAWHMFYLDPTWTTYSSPAGVGGFIAVPTNGIPPGDNDELAVRANGDNLLIAFVDTLMQMMPGPVPDATDSGIYAKITHPGGTGKAMLYLRLKHVGGVPVSGYALELDDSSPPGSLILNLYELTPGPPPSPPGFNLIASATGTSSLQGIYHARFEVTGQMPITLAGSAWPIGMAERDACGAVPMVQSNATVAVASGFGGIGMRDAAGMDQIMFDDMVHYDIAVKSPITVTLLGFQGGGHFFAQVGNGNPDCPPIDVGAGYGPANKWCTPACLQMLMDYWDNRANNPALPFQLPQEQIAHVCNVNDIGRPGVPPNEFRVWTGAAMNYPGTQLDDSRRAIHFSWISQSLDGMVAGGYQGMRNVGPPSPSALMGPYGWSARCSTDGAGGWIPCSLAAGTPPSSAQKLRNFLDLGYPIILHLPPGMIWFPENSEKEAPSVDPVPMTEIGHSVICIGYHLTNPNAPMLNYFEFHDPWHGPNVWVDEATLFGLDSGITLPEPLLQPSIWYAAGGPYTWGGPWDIVGIPSGNLSGTFPVDATATYSDPIQMVMGPAALPVFPVDNATAEIAVSGGMEKVEGMNPQPLPSINISGSQGVASLIMNVTDPSPPDYVLRSDAWGSLFGMMAPPPSSTSYPVYIDEIGGYNQERVTLSGLGIRYWDQY